MPGTCAGIVLGLAGGGESIGQLWKRLEKDWQERPIVGRLAAEGPVGLLAEAVSAGYVPRDGYASKCHLCWEIRRFFCSRGLYTDELGPRWMYETCGDGAAMRTEAQGTANCGHPA